MAASSPVATSRRVVVGIAVSVVPVASLAWLATRNSVHLLSSCDTRDDRCFTAEEVFIVAVALGIVAVATAGVCHLITMRRAPQLGRGLVIAVAAAWAIIAVLLCVG
ncbi:MAG TPA: hypothetical protein VFV63_05575 [Ilumatobacteraceae bacterium]|nr:hypothetical protein [Ilumatobacteraceae bacterium]